MRLRTLILSMGIVGWMGVLGCGNNTGDSSISPDSNAVTGDESEKVQVMGNARLGSQCPLGTFASPQDIPIELYSCPLGLPKVELNEPLTPIVLQVDCKKKTIDVRGGIRSLNATTWEMMPDGSFYFSVDGGKAVLKDDGMGNTDCETPLTAVMWGYADCTDRDHAKVHVETVWWLGKTIVAPPVSGPGSSPRPTSTPGANPGSRPTTLPSGYPPISPNPPIPPLPGASPLPPPPMNPPSGPTPNPSSTPFRPFRPFLNVESAFPGTEPEMSVAPSPSPAPAITPTPTRKSCVLPEGCYFHNISRINQCS
jgi:hypothetical protein